MKWRPQSRRGFLGGAGTILALPFLESLAPTAARAAEPIRRALFVFSPNGFVWDSIYPDTPGPNYTMPATLKVLEPFRKKVGLAFHLDNSVGRFPGDHASGTGASLTATRPKQTGGSDIACATSIDQNIVQGLGQLPTKYQYLNMGFTHANGTAGGTDFGVSQQYTASVSWASPTKQLPVLQGPGNAFDMLFSGSDKDASAADKARRLVYKKSVLDVNLAEAEALKNRLGTGDRVKLDRYMTSVRDLEMTLKAPSGGGGCSPGFSKPERVPNTNYYSDWVKGWYSIIGLALKCDLTRMVTFMLGHGFSNQSYGFLGINNGVEYQPDSMHHIISHHGGDGGRLQKLRAIDKHTFLRFSEFLADLESTDEGGGSTLLDNTIAAVVSDVAEGDHNHANFPIVTAGTAGGRLKSGEYFKLQGRTLGDLYTTYLRAFGISGKLQGDSKGPIESLLV